MTAVDAGKSSKLFSKTEKSLKIVHLGFKENSLTISKFCDYEHP